MIPMKMGDQGVGAKSFTSGMIHAEIAKTSSEIEKDWIESVFMNYDA